jgi:hypothetical protein
MYSQIISIVENTLKTLGIEPEQAKTGEGQFNIYKDNNTEVLIDVWEENNRVFFQVVSPVIKLNNLNDTELKMLLAENHGLVETSFALANDDIILKDTIECSAFFNQERAISTITRVSFYCELYKEKWNN